MCLEHSHHHVPYYLTQLPEEAHELIKGNLWALPSTIAANLRSKFPHVTAQQVHSAWSVYIQGEWKCADNQLDSAKILLSEMSEDVDIFELESLDGVVALAWGLSSVANMLKGKIVEVAIDATCRFLHC